MSELEELKLAYAECSRQRNELLNKLKSQAEQPAPMSQPNRVVAYSAASKLRELGYEWVDDAWRHLDELTEQPAQQEPTCKQDLQVWVQRTGQFSWEPQDERFWTRMQPAHHTEQHLEMVANQPAQQEPCEMGEMCIGCTPRNADGSCPGVKPNGACDCYVNGFNDGMKELEQPAQQEPDVFDDDIEVIGPNEIRSRWRLEKGTKLYTSPQPAQKQELVADALYFAQWTAAKKDLSDYICVGSLTLAGIEDGEYGQSEIDSLENTIEALQEKLVTGADHKKVPLLAYIGALNSTSPPAQRTWVGLTNTEKYALADDVARRGVPVFEAICESEAKLKDRNQ